MRRSVDYKAYIQHICLQALILLIKKLASPHLFAQLVWPIIEPDIKTLWQQQHQQQLTAINKENLNLLLTCLNKYNEETQRFLKAANLDLNGLVAHNADLFYDLIGQSSEYLPQLEPVCCELLTYLAEHAPKQLQSLWVDVLDARLFAHGKPEKKYLDFKLFVFTAGLVDQSNHQVDWCDGLQNEDTSGSGNDQEDQEFEVKSKQDLVISKQHWVISQISHLSKNVNLFQSGGQVR